MAAEGQGCKIDICDETVKVLEPRPSAGMQGLQHLISRFVMKKRNRLDDLWKIGVEDPKKFIHCLKVGLALTIVSLFYYMRPLYDALGGNTMWALMTVGLVFEYTVGATLSKCINRVIATISGGLLGIGINWITSHCDKQYEPVITGISVFVFGCVAEYFSKPETTNIPENDLVKKSQGYKCLLNSQAAEESMEKFARWSHGAFMVSWRQYVVICASACNCAYCIDNLNSCVCWT